MPAEPGIRKMFDLTKDVHKRFDPLRGEWVLVSPHRTARPWQGQVEKNVRPEPVTYDPECYLCPGNTRAGEEKNPDYKTTFVFDNDFPALLPETQPGRVETGGLLIAEAERGICRVVCFSPNHGLTLAQMKVPEIREVIDLWADEYTRLGSLDFINSVQIFENRGQLMGASNPHPHCQIWANSSIPDGIAKELFNCEQYREKKGGCLLCDYTRTEVREQTRVVCENEHFVVVVPFWAVWPFEVLLLSRDHAQSMDQFDDERRNALAAILNDITARYDRVFDAPFAYTMGFHQKPTDGGAHESFHFHGHFYPPLLRSATVRKFMVGYEMLAMPQRDITPESAAERLRSV